MARRMLNYGPGEWRALPWWVKDAYVTGMMWELARGGLNPHPLQPRQDDGGGAPSGFRSLEHLSPAQLAELGITT